VAADETLAAREEFPRALLNACLCQRVKPDGSIRFATPGQSGASQGREVARVGQVAFQPAERVGSSLARATP
jgi:hypothetical protein